MILDLDVLPGAVLRSVPRPRVGVKLLDHGLLFIPPGRDVGPGAGARHGRAEEDVDDEHQEEEDAEHDAEVQQPRGAHAAGGQAVGASRIWVAGLWKGPRFSRGFISPVDYSLRTAADRRTDENWTKIGFASCIIMINELAY